MDGVCSVSFAGITQDHWNRIKAALEQQLAIVVTQDTGADKAQGFAVNWSFVPIKETLVVNVTDAPFRAKIAEKMTGAVSKKIESMVEDLG